MNFKTHLFFITIYVLVFLFFKTPILSGFEVLHRWQVYGQTEYEDSRILEVYESKTINRTARYTIILNGKNDTPSINFIEDSFPAGADSSMLDYKKTWEALEDVVVSSEIPVKWVITRNGRKVFTELNGHRDIGGHMFTFYTSIQIFLWWYMVLTIIYAMIWYNDIDFD
jgi:hypothetical protein